MLIFDIETGPQPLEQLRAMIPEFPEFVEPGEFDPSTVKLGNLKDQAKINEKIEAARVAHEQSKATARQDWEAAKAKAEQDFVDRAALSAATGQVLAIGYYSAEKQVSAVQGVDAETDEVTLLESFWKKFVRNSKTGTSIVGFNSNQFDLPFLVRRSWILGVDIPNGVRNGRYFSNLFIDVREVWLCGQRWNECESSLNHVAKALGVGAKTDGVCGADFARLWNGTEEEKAKAVEYLTTDVELTYQVACRLGVC